MKKKNKTGRLPNCECRMRIEAVVKAGSKVIAVEKRKGGIYHIRVKEPAREGRANEAVIEALSDYLHIPKRLISIKRGLSSRNKIILIAKD